MYRVNWAIVAVLCRKVGLCIQNAGLCLDHRQTRWINIEATLVSRPVVGVEESCVGSVLE